MTKDQELEQLRHDKKKLTAVIWLLLHKGNNSAIIDPAQVETLTKSRHYIVDFIPELDHILLVARITPPADPR